jgi:hypothetical protein
LLVFLFFWLFSFLSKEKRKDFMLHMEPLFAAFLKKAAKREGKLKALICFSRKEGKKTEGW